MLENKARCHSTCLNQAAVQYSQCGRCELCQICIVATDQRNIFGNTSLHLSQCSQDTNKYLVTRNKCSGRLLSIQNGEGLPVSVNFECARAYQRLIDRDTSVGKSLSEPPYALPPRINLFARSYQTDTLVS